jgi:hypothetical protein
VSYAKLWVLVGEAVREANEVDERGGRERWTREVDEIAERMMTRRQADGVTIGGEL